MITIIFSKIKDFRFLNCSMMKRKNLYWIIYWLNFITEIRITRLIIIYFNALRARLTVRMMHTVGVHITTSAASLNFSLPKHVILSLAQMFHRFSLSDCSLAHLLQIISPIFCFSALIGDVLSLRMLIGGSIISRLEMACDWLDVAFTGGGFTLTTFNFRTI